MMIRGVRISEESRQMITLGLNTYRAEVSEIREAILRSSQAAGFNDDRYVPEDLRREIEAIEDSFATLRIFAENTIARISGHPVPKVNLQVMHSALLLYRDDLASELENLRQDRMTPLEAIAPLEDRVNTLNDQIDKFWNQFGTSPYLSKIRARRVLRAGLQYPEPISVEAALADGEGQTIEFKREFPKQASDLAVEIAAFASTNPGTIFMGISDGGTVVGMEGCESQLGQDELRKRIEGITSNSVVPSVLVKITFEEFEGKFLARISVPRGGQPMYYCKNIPYVRHLSSSRPAQPQEVIDAVRKHREHRGLQ